MALNFSVSMMYNDLCNLFEMSLPDNGIVNVTHKSCTRKQNVSANTGKGCMMARRMAKEGLRLLCRQSLLTACFACELACMVLVFDTAGYKHSAGCCCTCITCLAKKHSTERRKTDSK
jgi:hypothetical protein